MRGKSARGGSLLPLHGAAPALLPCSRTTHLFLLHISHYSPSLHHFQPFLQKQLSILAPLPAVFTEATTRVAATLHPCTAPSRFYRSNHKGCSYSPSLHRSQPFLYRSLIDYEVSGTSYYSPLTDYLANTYPFPLNNLANNKGFFI